MAERLHAEPLYHPLGGINPDSNGVSMRTDEAYDMLNLDITTSEIKSRVGTTILGGFLSEEPDDVVMVLSGAGAATFDGNYISYPNLEVPVYLGGLRRILIYEGDDPEGVTPRLVSCYVDSEGVYNWDIGSFFDPDRYVATTTTFYIPPESEWTSPGGVYNPVPTIVVNYIQTNEPVIEYHKYNHPTQGTTLFAFCASNIYRYIENLGWISVLDPGLIGAWTVKEQWSTTDFVDRELGATVVAAGSLYTRPNDPYEDGSSRVLLYFDFTADHATGDTEEPYGYFKTYEMFSEGLDEQNLGIMTWAGGQGGIVTNDIVPPAANGVAVLFAPLGELLPGTAYVVVDGIGVVATAGTKVYTNDATGIRYNRLLPVDEQVVAFGDNSFITLDGNGDFSIEFLRSTYNGNVITIYYSYALAVVYRPLYLSNFHGSLIMGNTAELVDYGSPEWTYFPWRVRWTLPGYGNIARQGDFQELYLDDISPILAMKALETVASSNIFGPLYIYKHNSIVRATYNQNFGLDPDLPVPMLSFEIAYSEGIEATRTIVAVNGVHLYLGRNDVYAFDGSRRISLTEDQETKNTRVQKRIFDNLDLSNLQNSFAVYDEINRQYMLFVKLSNGVEYPTDCLVYDLDLQNWRRYTYPETSAGIGIDLSIGRTIADLVGDIAGLKGQTAGNTGFIEDLLLNGVLTKKLIFSMGFESYYTAGNLDRSGAYDDEYLTYFITRDFFAETLEEDDRTQRVYAEGKLGSIEMGISPYYGEQVGDFTTFDEKIFPSTYSRRTFSPDNTAIHVRFLLTLKDMAIFRWMQVFSKRQEFTND